MLKSLQFRASPSSGLIPTSAPKSAAEATLPVRGRLPWSLFQAWARTDLHSKKHLHVLGAGLGAAKTEEGSVSTAPAPQPGAGRAALRCTRACSEKATLPLSLSL